MQLLSSQIWESNIHSLSLTKKKQQKDDHVILENENRPGTIIFVFIIGCVEALALRNKKEVEGRRGRERERRSKEKKGGSKGKFEWFLCTRKKIIERQTTVRTFQGGDTLVTSSTHFPSFTRLSDKSPPLPDINSRHDGTRNVSYRSSSLCCRTACS